MSHIAITYHLVLSTKNREQTIVMNHERELYKVIFDFCKQRSVFVWRIGGMPDHVHILLDIPAKLAVADFVRLLKSESSKFMRVNQNFPTWNGWSEGYGAFSVDASSRAVRIEYIKNQKNHHQSKSFKDEYAEILSDHGIHVEIM